jgi:DnaJ family protein C protein 7
VYNEALAIDTDHGFMNRIFFANRAAALMKLGKYKEALRDCTKAIEIDPNYLKAFLRRASIFSTLENYADSVKDYQQAARLGNL